MPEFEGGVNAVEAAKNELPEYTEAIGTVGDEPAPSVENQLQRFKSYLIRKLEFW